MENNKVCPICGSSEIGKGRQIGGGGMLAIKGTFTRSVGSVINADIYTECGHILSMRVGNHEIFKIKK